MAEYPISLPDLLWDQWIEDGCDGYLAAREAARWGADQELEACISLMLEKGWMNQSFADNLRAARRPKPPSLKEQALAALDDAVMQGDCITISDALPTIRRALEQLDD